jgi:hypothetical protein
MIVTFFVMGAVAFLPTASQGDIGFQTEFPIAQTSSGFNQLNPSLATFSSNIICVGWDENINGNTEIFVARSIDGGDSFGSPIRLTDSDGQTNHSRPVLDFDSSGRLLVAWESEVLGDTDILVVKSQDPWGSFTSPVEASDGPMDTEQVYLDLAVDDGGIVHVVWEDRRDNRDVRASSAPVSTLDFGGSVKINDDLGNAWQEEPTIDTDEHGDVYVAWYDRRDGDPSIYMAKSTDGGQTYGSNLRVSGSTTPPQFEPDIEVIGGNVHVVWQDGRTGVNRDIYYASAPSDSLVFGTSVKVNRGTSESNQGTPSLSVEPDGTVHVVWQDYRDGVSDVYYGVSSDGGRTFRDEKVNEAGGDPILEKAYPQVSVNTERTIYVVWEDMDVDDAKTMMAISGNGGNGLGSTDLLMWIVIAVLAVVVATAVVVFIRRRRAGRPE